MKAQRKPVAIPRPGNGVPRRRLARSAADFLPSDRSLSALRKAARSRISRRRGENVASDWAPRVIATWHPSALLRAPEERDRQRMKEEFFEDIVMAVRNGKSTE